MPISELLLRLLIPTVLAVSAVYAGLSALKGHARRRRGEPAPGVYPGSAAHQEALSAAGVTSMAEWRRMSTVGQEVADACAIAEEGAGVAGEDAVWAARVAARDVVERSRVNSLFHP